MLARSVGGRGLGRRPVPLGFGELPGLGYRDHLSETPGPVVSRSVRSVLVKVGSEVRDGCLVAANQLFQSHNLGVLGRDLLFEVG